MLTPKTTQNFLEDREDWKYYKITRISVKPPEKLNIFFDQLSLKVISTTELFLVIKWCT